MWTATLILLALLVLLVAASIGGSVYEAVVLDPVWPHRPAIVQPRHGGVSRRRFWTPLHVAVEVTLIASVVVTWSQPAVRTALLVALTSHVAVRVWTLVDLMPKAAAFEEADPARVDRARATSWTRRSLLRLPLQAVTCVAALSALIAAA